MTKFADATGDALLDVLVTATPATKCSLHTADPGYAGLTAELSGNGYARADVTMESVDDQVIANDDTVTFGPASANWTAVTHFSLWAGSTFLVSAPLSATKTIQTDDTASFATGTLKISTKPIT